MCVDILFFLPRPPIHSLFCIGRTLSLRSSLFELDQRPQPQSVDNGALSTSNAIAQAAFNTKMALEAICDIESTAETYLSDLPTFDLTTGNQRSRTISDINPLTWSASNIEAEPRSDDTPIDPISVAALSSTSSSSSAVITTSAMDATAVSTVPDVSSTVRSTTASSSSSSSLLSTSANVTSSIKQTKRRQSLQFLVSTVPTLHRNLMKRKSEVNLQSSLAESQTKVKLFFSLLSCFAVTTVNYISLFTVCL